MFMSVPQGIFPVQQCETCSATVITTGSFSPGPVIVNKKNGEASQ